MIELVLEGNVPSKKNQRINTKEGLSFPSKAFSDWQDEALIEVRRQTRHRFLVPVSMELIIYFGNDTRSDLDNRLTSILDMLVEALVLRDDKWQDVPLIKVEAQYRKNKPGAFIRLEELPADFFGAELEKTRAKRKKKPLP